MPALQNLPPEILIPCLAYTGELDTVLSALSWSRHFLSTLRLNEEALFRLLAKTKGYTRWCSAGDAGIESPEEVEPSKTFEEGLDKVIACQNSGIGAYDGVSSWKELVLRRARCDANWKDGLYSLSTIYQTDVWRLKVNTARRELVTSSPFSGIKGMDLVSAIRDPKPPFVASRLWHMPAPAFSHIELSEGYLIYMSTRGEFVVLCARQDGPGYQLERPIVAPAGHQLRFLKARKPFLVSGNDRNLFVWDFTTGQLQQHISLGTSLDVSYVELSKDFIFVCTEEQEMVAVFHRGSGDLAYTIPPTLSWQEEGNAYKAVHHDPTIGVAVMITTDNRVTICGCYDDPVNAPSAIVTASLSDELAACSECSVENGRAAIVALDYQDGRGCQVLEMIYLRRFTSVDDFLTKPFEIRTMDLLMPALGEARRIEMDSTAIYVAGSNLTEEEAADRHRQLIEPDTDDWTSSVIWFDAQHKEIAETLPRSRGKIARRPTDDLLSLEPVDENQHARLLRVDPDRLCDSVLVYRFL